VSNNEFTIQANSAQAECMDRLTDLNCGKYKLLLKNIFYNIDYEQKFAKSIDLEFGYHDPTSAFVILEHIELDGSSSQFRFFLTSDSKELTQYSPNLEEYVDSCGSVFDFLIQQLSHDTLFNVLNSEEDNFMHKASYQLMGKPKDMKTFYGVDEVVFRKLQIERPYAQSLLQPGLLQPPSISETATSLGKEV
jgi:hypothetical protein